MMVKTAPMDVAHTVRFSKYAFSSKKLKQLDASIAASICMEHHRCIYIHAVCLTTAPATARLCHASSKLSDHIAMHSIGCGGYCLFVSVGHIAKTAEPIEMPFGVCTRMDSTNHVLDKARISRGEGAVLGAQWRGA